MSHEATTALSLFALSRIEINEPYVNEIVNLKIIWKKMRYAF